MMYHPKSLISKSFMNPIIRVFKLVSIFQKVLTKVVHIPNQQRGTGLAG